MNPTIPFPYDEWERGQTAKGRDFDTGCHICGRKVGKNPAKVWIDDSHGFVLDPAIVARLEAGEPVDELDGNGRPITGHDGCFEVGPVCVKKYGLGPYTV